MHTSDVLHYGHLTLERSVRDVPEEAWLTTGACGVWSIKDIVSHLASFELLLKEICMGLRGEGPTPTIDRYRHSPDFNDQQVAQRSAMSPVESLEEYRAAHDAAMSQFRQLPDAILRKSGALKWYGEEYDLEDFLVYTFYGHKREHSAQIAAFLDRWPS